MGNVITYVSMDDWAGLYINGQLQFEGHSVPAFEWVEAINKVDGPVVAEELSLDDNKVTEWIESLGNLPQNLGDIPEEIRAR